MLQITDYREEEPDKVFSVRNGITLYDSAWKKLRELLNKETKMIRISLEPSGCAGVSYTAQLDGQAPSDVLVDFGDGVSLLVDKTPRFPSQESSGKFYSDWDFLEGLHLRYEESIMSSQFVMDNPNSERGCSCGISFKPKDYGGKPKSCRT
ncbi:MAG TPA: iron-sulfur cluster assembly accessory protein [Candidatus Hodarchaeales archaeon]|nr:iron-sulfur cluster assembly accessory protein [Candidatus Hodarchaeales archaeon]